MCPPVYRQNANGSATRVVVAMSGGVDSSVAAALLVAEGYDVIGMMMRLWSEPGEESYNRCCTPDSMAQARHVARNLGIPFYAIDAQQVFYDTVVTYFKDGYAQGSTPNPCLACNRSIRWEFLLNQALALGAGSMATGHYARLQSNDTGSIELLRAVDAQKDQSYILHVLGQEQLTHALFPLGGYTKLQVRQLARDFNLPVAERAESQDLCFLGKGDYRSFLVRNSPEIQNPGRIVNRKGETIGEHRGLAFYTIGQRKGLGLSSSIPLYVLDKDPQKNALIVGTGDELGRNELTTGRVNWVSGVRPEQPLRAQIKIRYKANEAWGTVTPLENGHAHVRFDSPLRDITPGQAAVFYDGETCLGGGIILAQEEPLRSLPEKPKGSK
jgi:tRNA-specific 2-thiouridylase